MSRAPSRKPWPLKWVFIAILLCIVPYTWLTLKYRKTEKEFEPYEDIKQHANVIRLLDAGYQRISVTAERPADPQTLVRAMRETATPTNVAGGLTKELAETLVEVPMLPQSFLSVTTPASATVLLPYPILFECTLADQKHQLGGAQLFLKENTLVIIPQFEVIRGELTARTKESMVLVTVPGKALKTGRYTVILTGSQQSKQWTLEVK